MGNKNVDKKGGVKTAQQNDLMVNRMMILFVIATIIVVALLLLTKSGKEYLFVLNVIPYFRAVGGLLFAGTVGYFLYNKNRGLDESGRMFESKHYVMIAFLLFTASVLYPIAGGSKIIISIVIAIVLSFVYNFYQRDFFWYSIFTALGTLSLFAIKSGYSASPLKYAIIIILEILAVFIPLVIIIFMPIIKKNSGGLGSGKKRINIMKKDWLYFPFIIGAAVLLIGAALVYFVMGAALYAIIVFLFLYLVFAIIYTVKMI